MVEMVESRGGWVGIRLLMTLASCAMLLSMPFPAFAVAQQVQVTVNVPQILDVEYTGSSTITFNVTCCDLKAGSKTILDQGDVNWCSNVAPWVITVQRSVWHTPNRTVDPGLILKVRYGSGGDSDWVTVHTDQTSWIDGSEAGTGTFEGIDWKIKGLNCRMRPGTYWCEVMFTIVGGG